jgi:DNA-binding response OmpR family regulator
MAKILVVDDDEQIGEQLKEILTSNGHNVTFISDGEEAMKVKENFDIILLDLVMPKVDGLYLLTRFKKSHPDSQVISAVTAMRRGASDYISKPFRSKQIETAIQRALEEARFVHKIEEKKKTVFEPYAEDLQEVLNSLANSFRHGIIEMLKTEGRSTFGDIRMFLNIEDSPKLSFHLRKLMSSGIIEQDRDKKYILSEKGEKVVEMLDQLKLGIR